MTSDISLGFTSLSEPQASTNIKEDCSLNWTCANLFKFLQLAVPSGDSLQTVTNASLLEIVPTVDPSNFVCGFLATVDDLPVAGRSSPSFPHSKLSTPT
jgi:hypothetical protein